MSTQLFANDGILWSIRALDISGNYGQKISLDSSSNIQFRNNGNNSMVIYPTGNIDLSGNTTFYDASNKIVKGNFLVSDGIQTTTEGGLYIQPSTITRSTATLGTNSFINTTCQNTSTGTSSYMVLSSGNNTTPGTIDMGTTTTTGYPSRILIGSNLSGSNTSTLLITDNSDVGNNEGAENSINLFNNLGNQSSNSISIRCASSNIFPALFSYIQVGYQNINIVAANNTAIQVDVSNVIFSYQLTLPNTLSSTSFATNVLTCDFRGRSTGIFSATLTTNMTGILFSNGRIGGQYVIYISASGGTRTIASTLTGTTNRTNYTSAVSVATTSTGILTITYDGTRYLIACSAYN